MKLRSGWFLKRKEGWFYYAGGAAIYPRPKKNQAAFIKNLRDRLKADQT
jgi:hypothetical protein